MSDAIEKMVQEADELWDGSPDAPSLRQIREFAQKVREQTLEEAAQKIEAHGKTSCCDWNCSTLYAAELRRMKGE